MFGLSSLSSLFCYNGSLWTIMDHNRVVLAIMEKSIFPDVPVHHKIAMCEGGPPDATGVRLPPLDYH